MTLAEDLINFLKSNDRSNLKLLSESVAPPRTISIFAESSSPITTAETISASRAQLQ